jgi:hypothetical protein
MKLGYTEFSYGYAFTENLIRSMSTAPLGAPIFPNLVQEGQMGFDVRIDRPGLPLFFQYKLPELMLRNSAFEISKYNLPGITVPFFRMRLMRRDLSEQHRLLMELEKRYPLAVLYASPVLDSGRSFNNAYNTASVHQRSIFFSPSDIGALPDDAEHSVAYRDGLAFAYLCTEPKRIKTKTYEHISDDVLSLFHESKFSTLRNASAELRDTVRSLASDAMRGAENLVADRISVQRMAAADRPAIPEDQERTIMDILVSREMARIDLGIDVLIAQPKSS